MGRVALLNTAIGFAVILLLRGETLASHHYTDKQMDALAHRIGKIFWLNAANGKIPTFVDGPSAKAGKVQPGVNESFIITDVAGRARKDPFYSVKFESGKIAYISPEMFHEALNLTIVSSDPRADEKTQAGQREREEKERVEWIQAQPWPQVVKQAAIRKQATPGLNTGEVKRVLGDPQRITRLRGPLKVAEQHWFYPDGSVLIFHNELLTRIESPEKK